MRSSSSWWVAGLFPAICWGAPAANYSDCVAAADPPACLVGAVRANDRVRDALLLEADLRLGLVDFAIEDTVRLARVANAQIRDGIWSAQRVAGTRKPKLRDVSAAIVLLAAARRHADPFADLRVAKAVPDRRLAATWALSLWLEMLRNGPPDQQVRVAGLPALWSAAAAGVDSRDAVIDELAGAIAFFEGIDGVIEPWFLARAQDATLSPDAKARLASQLARFFRRYELAEELLESGGNEAQRYDVRGIRGAIARARLRVGPDAAALRTVVDELVRDAPGDYAFGPLEAVDRDLLERLGAREELGELARAYAAIGRGAAEQNEISHAFGAASDCFRRAGDLDAARAAARLALPRNPRDFDAKQFNSAAATGARALYRAGLVDEALATGRLPGFERYVDAPVAGEVPDPQWVFDEPWRSSGPPFLVLHAIASKDPGDRERAYAKLRHRCADLRCSQDELAMAAELAASVGDAVAVRDFFAAKVRAVSGGREERYLILTTAGQWEHARELLGDR